MRAEGASYRVIACALRRNEETINCRLNPSVAERKSERQCRWREANPEKAREYSRCWRKANPEKAREAGRRWRKANPEKYREACRLRGRRWSEVNPERRREAYRRHREANREKLRKACLRWRNANLEKARDASRRYVLANPEKAKQASLRWRRNNPEKGREARRRREAMKRAGRRLTLVPLTFKQKRERMALFGDLCAYCGTAGPLTVDHVLALSAGGLDEAGNIAPACRSCNSGKWTRPVEGWYRSQPFFSEARWRKIQRHCPAAVAGQLPLALG